MAVIWSDQVEKNQWNLIKFEKASTRAIAKWDIADIYFIRLFLIMTELQLQLKVNRFINFIIIGAWKM